MSATRPALLLVGAVLFACAGAPAPEPAVPVYTPIGGRRAIQADEQQRLRLFVAVNVARRLAGRAPLAPDPALDLAAQQHAEDMLRRGYFSHRDRRGNTPAQRAERAGYGGAGVGENLARGAASAERVVELWRQRRGHRRNLLDPSFQRTGIGYASNDDSEGIRVYWVQLYGR